jgi:hypothetical protein
VCFLFPSFFVTEKSAAAFSSVSPYHAAGCHALVRPALAEAYWDIIL